MEDIKEQPGLHVSILRSSKKRSRKLSKEDELLDKLLLICYWNSGLKEPLKVSSVANDIMLLSEAGLLDLEQTGQRGEKTFYLARISEKGKDLVEGTAETPASLALTCWNEKNKRLFHKFLRTMSKELLCVFLAHPSQEIRELAKSRFEELNNM